MMYVYSRLTPAQADAGWLVGASARGLPHRRAWIDNAGRPNSDGSNIWRDMAFAAPAPQPRKSWPGTNEDAYILQQDPSGLWFVDAWTDNAGTIRSARPGKATPAASSRDLANTCFIIELEHATQR